MRGLLVVDGCLLLLLARFSLWPRRIARASLPAIAARTEIAGDLSRRTALVGLTIVTACATALRLVGLDNSLWLDEISPRLFYGEASIRQILVSYISSNNHLLNTLLTNGSVAALGEREWVVRLPAILFGIASIPAVYALARLAMTRWASLGSALLVAVSYHHIFFSQNSRGYSAQLFFSMVGAVCLVEGLRDDRGRWWLGVVLAAVGNVMSQLLSVFVLAGHALVVLAAVAVVWRRGDDPAPLARRVAVVFGFAGLVIGHVYLPVAPQMNAVMRAVYGEASAGFVPFSLTFLEEVVRGVAAGFGPGIFIAALPVLGLAAVGFFSLARASRLLAALLVVPSILLAVFLVTRGMAVSPRFFLFALIVTFLSCSQGLAAAIGGAARHLRMAGPVVTRVGLALLVLTAALSAAALPRYYQVPKQAFRESLDYVESIRRPGDIVFVIYYAEVGYLYYGRARRIRFEEDYFIVRSSARFDEVLARHPDRRVIVVTTFGRALHLNVPDLEIRIENGWRVVREFPGTVGDGAVKVWLPSF